MRSPETREADSPAVKAGGYQGPQARRELLAATKSAVDAAGDGVKLRDHVPARAVEEHVVHRLAARHVPCDLHSQT
jgi:hypothetical protein